MKTNIQFHSTILQLLFALFILAASSELVAQERKSTDLKEFKIVVEKTENGIKMKSFQGSAWIDLSFSLNSNQSQAIDEYGMTELEKNSSTKDTNLADFLFIVSETDKGIALKGIEGTAWTHLNFSLPENGKQEFNQHGMIN